MIKAGSATLVLILVSGIVIFTGFSSAGQSTKTVKNLDTGELFGSIQAAIDDSDTDKGDIIVVYPGEEHFDAILVQKDELKLRSQLFPKKPVIKGISNTTENGASYYDVATDAYGIRLVNSNTNIFRHFHVTEVSSKAKADTSDIGGEGNAFAEAISYGIRLEDSDENSFEHIDLSEISSKAIASTDSGNVEAKAYAFGISLKNSSGNRFEHIDLNDISSEATASTESGTKSIDSSTIGIDLVNSNNNIFKFNVISNNELGVRNDSSDTELHYNNISGNTGYGIKNNSNTSLDASLNWWGSARGPEVDLDWKNFEYDGNGDLISGNGPIVFSPWLSENPDGDAGEPGVQLISPFTILVKKVGPIPTTESDNTGYIDMAIWGASNVPQKGRIIVPHGTYKASEPINNNVALLSIKGTTCKTCLKDIPESKIRIDGNNVTVGKLDYYTPRGFVIKDEVVVESGTDASTVHLNWNDLRNTVTNEGSARLDAEYNWWGDLDPSDDVKGKVDYRPFLPEEPCSFSKYMEKHNITDPKAAIAGRMVEGKTCSKKLPARLIVKYKLKPREAEALVKEHGCYDVRRAMEKEMGSFSRLKNELGANSY